LKYKTRIAEAGVNPIKINIERVDNVRPSSSSPVTLKQAGNTLEIRYTEKNRGGLIQKISATEYVDRRTGEVFKFNKTAATRADNLKSVKQSIRRLRDIINCNTTQRERCLWVTLTYKENMRDAARLYRDTEKFYKRLRYYLDKRNMPRMESITAIEPQARGSLHCHCIWVFAAKKAPFIPNDIVQKLWQRGFTSTKSLKRVKNPGAYLTAYLCDLELTQAARLGVGGDAVKEVEAPDEDGKPVKKSVVKGARLKLMPKYVKLFRCSHGIKRPAVRKCTENEAMKIVGDSPLVYEKTICISNETEKLINTINYRTYDRKSKPD
jgi:hypothetical protein